MKGSEFWFLPIKTMEPLAFKIRPKKFNEVFGQDHLVGKDGILTLMIEKQKPMSFILYGPPGCGKTTIANIFVSNFDIDTYFFNASTDNKARLIDILNTTNYNNIIVIIDEIHRMKTDIQDYLLPFVESGKAVFIGLTTLNPYQSVNWAIRSRSSIYEVKVLSNEDIILALKTGVANLDIDIKVENTAYETIVRLTNNEVRSALNLLEIATLSLNDGDTLTSNIVLRVAGKKNFSLDASGDNYYLMLSALQKSIRGSDTDAAIHYLARLITLGDLNSIIRRLLVITYEDIGLANPKLHQEVLSACEASKIVGLPEARIILANIVIQMAISPKSNTAYLAINDALTDYENIDTGTIPNNVNNSVLKDNPSLYHYPHDYENALNDERYLPEKINSKTYYHPKTDNPYEKALGDRLKVIDKIKGIQRKKE